MSISKESIELWVKCKSFPQLEVSNQGRVRVFKSLKSSNIGRILKQRDDKDGYKSVAINRTTARVHRLVAEAFIPNPNSNEVVHHKDNVKHNNDASNLEWTTISYNTKHAHFVNVLRSPKAKYVKASIDGIVFSYYESCSQCAEYFGVGRDLIESCVTNKTLFKGLVVLEDVTDIPEGSVTNKKLTNKLIARRINPHKIYYRDGFEFVVESLTEFATHINKSKSTAQNILFHGASREKYGIDRIEKISQEEYYRTHLNW